MYSIYAAITHSNCKIISFEPSSNNLRVLTRNISINGLEERISVFANPLSNKNEKFLMMQDNEFREGGHLILMEKNLTLKGKTNNLI